MAAPSIPNLNTLRSGRGRGRGRGGIFPSARQDLTTSQKDAIVQQTDGDASQSRLSAVAMNYLDDPFASFFVTGETPRRYPIINRGTFARTTAIDILVQRFLQQAPGEAKQIISLGAGSDTRYFRFARKYPEMMGNVVYHELDFVANTRTKVQAVKTHSLIRDAIGKLSPVDFDKAISAAGDALISDKYCVHPIDLRSLAYPEASHSLPQVSATTPTLLISECCLCYLPPDLTVSILKTISTIWMQPSTPLALVIYEPIRPFDAFGQVMESNLAARGIHLQTLHRYSTLRAQRSRLEAAGLVAGQRASDIDFIFDRWISDGEKERIARCEMLDELEEWRLLAKHYCIAWGWRSSSQVGVAPDDLFGAAWCDFSEQPHDGD